MKIHQPARYMDCYTPSSANQPKPRSTQAQINARCLLHFNTTTWATSTTTNTKHNTPNQIEGPSMSFSISHKKVPPLYSYDSVIVNMNPTHLRYHLKWDASEPSWIWNQRSLRCIYSIICGPSNCTSHSFSNTQANLCYVFLV